MNHLVFIVMDSARYDSVTAAATPNLARLGPLEKRYSYASWTAPSHYAFFMGLLPHTNPRGVFASEVYKAEFLLWRDRLDAPGLEFKSFVPRLSLPAVLHRLGYRCTAFVSLPVLNPFTVLSTASTATNYGPGTTILPGCSMRWNSPPTAARNSIS